MKKIEYLVSTMNQNNIEFLKNMNIKNDIVVINQTNYNQMRIIKNETQKIKFISVNEKGLSKSRNMAIENSRADICVLADDDFKYYDNASNNILKAYEKHPDADIIAFYYNAKGRQKKDFDGRCKRINYITSLKLCSAQITFKRESIIKNYIRFNEDFGAGAEKYKAGEESIFLYECLKKRLKIYIEPIYILEIDERADGSAWFEGYNKNFFETKGAAYFEMTHWFWLGLILQFAIRKQNLYKDAGISIRKAILYMLKAGIEYNKKTKKCIYMLGDFNSNTGPAIVNKKYYSYIKKYAYIGKEKGKLKRIMDYLFKIRKCKVVLISGLSKFQLLGCKIAKRMNKKVLYLMHGYTEEEYKANNVKEEEQTLKETEKTMLEMVDRIICVSEKFSEFLKEKRPDLEEKICFVNNGIDSIETEQKEKDKKKFTVISVGGGIKRKNNLTVCEAINKIKNLKIEFIVIGNKGTDGHEIEQYKFVKYYEKLSHDEVLKKMREADLYIQNSSFETFGLSIFEAISQGCKILISQNVGALSIIENIDKDEIIYNVQNVDEIKIKIEKAILTRNLKKNYIDNWNLCSWEKSAEKLLNLSMENNK